MAARGQLPTVGARVEVEAVQPGEDEDETVLLELTVTELDGRRAARLELKRVPTEAPAAAGGPPVERWTA